MIIDLRKGDRLIVTRQQGEQDSIVLNVFEVTHTVEDKDTSLSSVVVNHVSSNGQPQIEQVRLVVTFDRRSPPT